MWRPNHFERADEKFSHNVDLRVRPHMLDEYPVVSFEGKTKKQSELYNRAIREVLDQENLGPIYQATERSGGQNEPGYHVWEVQSGTDKTVVEKLLPKIEERVKELKVMLGIE